MTWELAMLVVIVVFGYKYLEGFINGFGIEAFMECRRPKRYDLKGGSCSVEGCVSPEGDKHHHHIYDGEPEPLVCFGSCTKDTLYAWKWSLGGDV